MASRDYGWDLHGLDAQSDKLRALGVRVSRTSAGQRKHKTQPAVYVTEDKNGVLRDYSPSDYKTLGVSSISRAFSDAFRSFSSATRHEIQKGIRNAEGQARSKRAIYDELNESMFGGKGPRTVEELWQDELTQRQIQAEKDQATIRGIRNSGPGGSDGPSVLGNGGGAAPAANSGIPPVTVNPGSKDGKSVTQAINQAQKDADAAAAAAAGNEARTEWEKSHAGEIAKNEEMIGIRNDVARAEADVIRRKREAMRGVKIGATIVMTNDGRNDMVIEKIGPDGSRRGGDALVAATQNRLKREDDARRSRKVKSALSVVDDVIGGYV